MRSSGMNAVPDSSSGSCRVSATSICWNGFALETDQSLPKAILAPVSWTDRIGYILLALTGAMAAGWVYQSALVLA